MQLRKEILILSPFEIPDIKLAIKAVNAGAFPILHLGRKKKEGIEALKTLANYTDKPIGICLTRDSFFETKLPSNVKRVLLPYGIKTPDWKGVDFIYQVYSFEEAKSAIDSGVTAIAIKGSEGAGEVAQESSFVLFQRIMSECTDPKTNIYIQGGVGIHSASAFLALGAKGVILDSQIALFPECSAPKELKNVCAKLSGSETILVDGFRVLHRNNSPELPSACSVDDLRPYLGGYDLDKNYLPLGQDITISSDLLDQCKNLRNLISAIQRAHYGHLTQAKNSVQFNNKNLLAEQLGTKYPIAQGPMARISDVPDFLNEIAEAGALPFFAMGTMTGDSCKQALSQASKALKDKPWGIGMLGFTLPKMREEQVKYILGVKPKVVLIAGGRPSLAKPFEKEGITVFLHVPSSSLLDIYLKEDAKNFIFEGRESGGHLGPLTSTVLWEKQINRLMEEEDKSSLSVFFAGGIHDSFSSAFVSIMSSTLTAKGVKTGVLMGTSYLYTKEAVATGALTEQYQQLLTQAERTVTIETGIGQETRCLKSPYTDYFKEEKEKLQKAGTDSQEMLLKLEEINIGRLRIAAKGIERTEEKILAEISKEEQLAKGLYMAGQVASMKGNTCTIKELHEEVAVNSRKIISELKDAPSPYRQSKPLDIAIIGMAGIFPDAQDIDEYWKNLIMGKDCMSEVSDERWNKELFYTPDLKDSDHVHSKWGGFIPRIDFDPMEFGMTPQSLASIEPVQLLSLLIAKRALEDAGFENLNDVDMDNTSVIFGAEGATELAMSYGIRSGTKLLLGELPDEVKNALPRLNSDSFAGVLSNVIAGRIANRLDLGGRNYTVDAACAASMAALDLGCQELYSNRSDIVVVGGADFHNGINDFLMFGSTYALSKKGYCASFDSESDGIALGEGIGVLILKRLEDAERDGDKIHAVIKGMGGSSDGKVLGMTAPSRKGQLKALHRAYNTAGILPSEVGMIEAHGTGTVVGDKTELNGLTDIFVDSGALMNQTYIGSVKSQIGHTKCAAGVASVIKAAKCLEYGVIPPTIHLTKPVSAYHPEATPFVFNTQATIWSSEKRIAGISSFGFGGTNFHAVIENYKKEIPETTSLKDWPSELFLFRGETLDEAKKEMQKVRELLSVRENIPLKNIAYTLASGNGKIQVSIVAGNKEDLLRKIHLAGEKAQIPGVYFREERKGKVAFLFSGQGSQRINMAQGLFVAFPSMRSFLKNNEEYEKILFPPFAFSEETKRQQQAEITDTRNAQPLLGIVDNAIANLLGELGIKPDMVAGHSYGEMAALCYAGAFPAEQLTSLSRKRAESILNAIGDDKGKMVAVNIPSKQLIEILREETKIWAVNYNSSKQTVLAGTTEAIDDFIKRMGGNGVGCKEINVACAFHSPLLSESEPLFAKVLKKVPFKTPHTEVWSNTTAERYPDKPEEIKQRLAEHLTNPVLFAQQLQNMYESGARVFIETGPGMVLGTLIRNTLAEDAVVIQTENSGGEAIGYLLNAIAQYIATGREINLAKLFHSRNCSIVNIENPQVHKRSITTWLINGHNAIPAEGKMPADGAYPFVKPVINLKELQQQKKEKVEDVQTDKIVLEYLDSMKLMIQNQQSLINNQRDVMLGYLGQVEITARPIATNGTVKVASNGSSTAVEVLEAEEETIETIEVEAPSPANESSGDENKLPNIMSLSKEELTNILLEVVSEKTGYPVDMLGMDMDLEADLSIDSIKRMEIIGALRERIAFPEDIEVTDVVIEKMASIKTFNGLIGWLEEMGDEESRKLLTIEAESVEETERTVKKESVEEKEEDTGIVRIFVAQQESALVFDDGVSIREKHFAVTDTGCEISAEIKKKLEEKGATADIVSAEVDLRQYDGIIFIHSYNSPVKYRVKDLYNITKSAGDMSRLKWHYTFTDQTGCISEQQGIEEIKNLEGFDGFIKCVAHEYPGTEFRIVNSYIPFDATSLPEAVIGELFSQNKHPDITYSEGKRFSAAPQLEKLESQEKSELPLDEDSVVMVLGGAQGISPDLILQLSKDHPCHYILIGRTVPLNEEEKEKYASLKTKEEIRKYLLNVEGMKVPAEIEKRVLRIFKANHIIESIQKLEDSGVRASYISTDVKNKKAFKELIKKIREEHGRIDAVIHAAGIIADKFLPDKTWESFEEVYDTKVNPLHVIIDELIPEIKLLVLFGSLASVYGNRGQCDYAAGNGVLDTAARILREKQDKRIICFNWGPWTGAGMVSSILEHELHKRNVALIELSKGAAMYADELKYGNRPSIIIAGGKSKDIEHFFEAKP